jgi:putative membrane protein insertion efficiency factor
VTQLRSVFRFVGTPFRGLLLGLIAAYRWLTSGLAPRCKYYPTCSAYAEGALRRHGVVKGTLLAMWRVLRCNPFSHGGVDHVPVVWYDAVIHSSHGVSAP